VVAHFKVLPRHSRVEAEEDNKKCVKIIANDE
jgi:hypothetical protein